MSKSKLALSVIVPVYNLQDFIEPCLRSLCMQGFAADEYEILCVNDGSTDASVEVIQRMAQQYPQIRLIEQANQGVSKARNTGIEAAQGEYLYFCDGDDFLEPYCLKKMVDLCLQQNAVSASFRFRMVGEQTTVPEGREDETELNWSSGRETPFYSGNAVLFILKRAFICQHDIRFKVGMRYAEDELFMYHVCRFLDFSKHIYVDGVFYYYRMRNTSACHVKKDTRLRAHYKDMVDMALEYRSYLQDKTLSPAMQKSTRNRFQYAVSNALQDALLIGERKPTEVLSELREKGLYPYGFMTELLKIKHPKTMLVNYMKFLYTVPLYYICVYKLRQMLKR